MKERDCFLSRLFVSYLFSCSGYDVDAFHEEITQITYDLIAQYVSSSIEMLRNCQNKNNQVSLLPMAFIKETTRLCESTELYEQEQEYGSVKKKQRKLPDYFLWNQHNQIKSAYQYVKRNIGKKEGTENDIVLLNKYKKMIDHKIVKFNASVASIKTLQGLLSPNGELPQKKNKKFIKFLLEEVFSRLKIAEGAEYAESTIMLNVENGWEAVLLPKLRSESEVIEKLFKELFSLRTNDCEALGKKFVEIYDAFLEIDQSDDELCESRCIEKYCKDDDKYTNDAILSSHIIGFMRWIPLISDKDYSVELLCSVSEIIEVIRDKVAAKIDIQAIDSSESAHGNNNLFLEESNLDLRKLLIKAMHDDPHIHFKFHEFYGICCPTLHQLHGGCQ